MHLRGVASPMINANKPYYHHIYINTSSNIYSKVAHPSNRPPVPQSPIENHYPYEDDQPGYMSNTATAPTDDHHRLTASRSTTSSIVVTRISPVIPQVAALEVAALEGEVYDLDESLVPGETALAERTLTTEHAELNGGGGGEKLGHQRTDHRLNPVDLYDLGERDADSISSNAIFDDIGDDETASLSWLDEDGEEEDGDIDEMEENELKRLAELDDGPSDF